MRAIRSTVHANLVDVEEAARILVEEYSRMAEVYEARAVPFHAALVTRLLDLAALRSGERVLDFGCGSGNLTLEAATRVGPSGSVVGVDRAEGMIRVAEQKAASSGIRTVRFERMDARALMYGSETFDAVLSCLGIPVVGRVQCFSEAFRVLRPGGRFAFCEWRWAGNPISKAFFEALRKSRSRDPPEDLARLREARRAVVNDPRAKETRGPDAWIRALKELGFGVVRIHTETHETSLADVDEYIGYMTAWGDNERELQLMDAAARAAFQRDLAERVAPLRSRGRLRISQAAHFCIAEKV